MTALRGLSKFAMRLCVAVIVGTALLLSAIRLALPIVDSYRDPLTRTLAEHLGYEVSVETLRLRLSGWRPRLTLEQVRLSDPRTGAEALTLRALELDVDLLHSWWSKSPRFNALTLVGARLVVQHFGDGGVGILGLEDLASDDPKALEAFLGRGQLNLVDAEIRFVDEGRDQEMLRLTDVCLRLTNHGWSHRLDLSGRPLSPASAAVDPLDADLLAREPGPVFEGLRLIATLEGPPGRPRSWDGRVYASLGGSHLGDLLPASLLGWPVSNGGSLLLESWNRVRAGRLEESLLRVDLVGLTLKPDPDSAGAEKRAETPPTLFLERLNALARARPLMPGWRLEIADLNISLGDADLSGLRLDLRLGEGLRLARLGLAAGRLDLADAARISTALPWELAGLPESLLAANPQGVVRDLELWLSRSPSRPAQAPWRWKTRAVFSQVGFDRTPATPGIQGLSARLAADQDGGELRLGSEGLVLDLNPLFSERLTLDALSARLSWRREHSSAWRLSGRNLWLENADLAGRVRFDLELPVDGGDPFLDLRASLHEGNSANIRPYLPVGVMAPVLVDWLERSIVSGHLSRGDLVFRGSLADYPFRHNEGRFELLLGFEDLLLDYRPGWPPVASASGHLRFLNQGLAIQVDRGRIYESDFAGGRLRIPDLWGPERLRIYGEARGPFADGLRALSQTPLVKNLGRLAEALTVTGESWLALDMDLPLVKQGRLGVVGRLSWPTDATLGIKGTPLSLSGLSGELNFTERGVEASSIGARLWGHPLRLSIATRGDGDAGNRVTRIEAEARTPVAELAQRLPTSLWGLVGGDLDWQLAVNLRNRDVSQERLPLDYQLSSRLQEVSIQLPPPLGKPAGVARDLVLEGRLVPGRSMDVRGHLGSLGANLKLEFGAVSPALVAGHLRLGAATAPPPERPGLFLDGRVEELDLPLWLAWSDSMSDSMRRRAGAGRGSSAETLGSQDAVLAGAKLEIGRLRLGDLRLTGVALALDPLADGWLAEVQSNELAGRVRIPAGVDEGRLDLAFDRLDLAMLWPAGGSDASGAWPIEPGSDPLGGLPSLDLRVTQLRWGRARLGRLDLGLRTGPEGIRLPRLTLAGGDSLALKGEGEWLRSATGGQSRIDLMLDVSDLGQLLDELNETSALEAAQLEARLRLDWPGGLDDFALRRAVGAIDLEVENGRFLKVEPGVGRILGFLNVGALSRRLALDFSDLYGQGFAFERMFGRIALGGGKAAFDDFTVEGPAGTLIVGGVSDLAAQRFDQRVTVEPKLGSSVALASAVAGGPVVGAAVYLVDRVAGNPIDRLGRYRYHVTGPWRTPELRRIGWEPLIVGDGEDRSTAGRAKTKTDRAAREENLFLDVE